VITTHPNKDGPITVAEGSDVKLECKATGNGTLNYEWKRALGSLPHNAKRSDGGKTLTIRNITISDSGQYYCEVNDVETNVTSLKAQVTVRSKLINC